MWEDLIVGAAKIGALLVVVCLALAATAVAVTLIKAIEFMWQLL